MDVESQPQGESESTQEAEQLKYELPLFARGMKSWPILDASFNEFLRRFAEKVLSETPTDRLASTLTYLKNIHYGVSNNMAHLSGQLISRAIKESKISHFFSCCNVLSTNKFD